jgi:hypothetical protein
MCCVVGCHNNEGENPELRFHCFPGRAWERERRAKWIRAVEYERLIVALSTYSTHVRKLISFLLVNCTKYYSMKGMFQNKISNKIRITGN